MKKLKQLSIACLAIIISVCALAGCANKKVAAGKYCAEGNTESYIEIFDNNTAKFINIDLSEAQQVHENNGDNIDVTALTATPIPFEAVDGYLYFSYHDGYALRAKYDFKNNSITFNGNVYTYQQ